MDLLAPLPLSTLQLVPMLQQEPLATKAPQQPSTATLAPPLVLAPDPLTYLPPFSLAQRELCSSGSLACPAS